MNSPANVLKQKVTAGQQGLRLDVFLHRAFPSYSRAFLQRLIQDRLVTAGGVTRKQSYVVREGDEIAVTLPEPVPLSVGPEELPLNIVYEDDDLAVIDKPAGMVVHPGAGVSSGTLVHALLYHLKNLSGIGGVLRPGIVHRLDKGTSGLLVVAKNDLSHHGLSAQLKQRKFDKEYVAVVWGGFSEKSGRIVLAVGRHRKDRKKMAVLEEGGREAITHYSVLRESRYLSVVALKPVTGRTHQLRVHLSHVGHPILGDDRYGGRRKTFVGTDERERKLLGAVLAVMERPALHARKVAFEHPATGKRVSFVSDLPADFRTVLEKVWGDATIATDSKGA